MRGCYLANPQEFGEWGLGSDAARPLSYKNKTIYFLKTKTGPAKTTFSRTIPRPDRF